MPALTSESVPPGPEMGVGPVADKVKSVGAAVPPWVLLTTLTSFKWATLSTYVQVQFSPSLMLMLRFAPVDEVEPQFLSV